MRQILVDQRHHRDAAEIDLLVARQGQQQVERTFEAFEIDDQLALARRNHVGAGGGEAVGGTRVVGGGLVGSFMQSRFSPAGAHTAT